MTSKYSYPYTQNNKSVIASKNTKEEGNEIENNESSNSDKGLLCCICWAKLSKEPVTATHCMHTFHSRCLSTWFTKCIGPPKCPTCKYVLNVKELNFNTNSEIVDLTHNNTTSNNNNNSSNNNNNSSNNTSDNNNNNSQIIPQQTPENTITLNEVPIPPSISPSILIPPPNSSNNNNSDIPLYSDFDLDLDLGYKNSYIPITPFVASGRYYITTILHSAFHKYYKKLQIQIPDNWDGGDLESRIYDKHHSSNQNYRFLDLNGAELELRHHEKKKGTPIPNWNFGEVVFDMEKDPFEFKGINVRNGAAFYVTDFYIGPSNSELHKKIERRKKEQEKKQQRAENERRRNDNWEKRYKLETLRLNNKTVKISNSSNGAKVAQNEKKIAEYIGPDNINKYNKRSIRKLAIKMLQFDLDAKQVIEALDVIENARDNRERMHFDKNNNNNNSNNNNNNSNNNNNNSKYKNYLRNSKEKYNKYSKQSYAPTSDPALIEDDSEEEYNEYEYYNKRNNNKNNNNKIGKKRNNNAYFPHNPVNNYSSNAPENIHLENGNAWHMTRPNGRNQNNYIYDENNNLIGRPNYGRTFSDRRNNSENNRPNYNKYITPDNLPNKNEFNTPNNSKFNTPNNSEFNTPNNTEYNRRESRYNGYNRRGPRYNGYNRRGSRDSEYNRGGPRVSEYNRDGPRDNGYNRGGPRDNEYNRRRHLDNEYDRHGDDSEYYRYNSSNKRRRSNGYGETRCNKRNKLNDDYENWSDYGENY